MLGIVFFNVMLRVIKLNAVTLSVMAPFQLLFQIRGH